MPDKDFPSGPWTGFYQYRDGRRGQMDLALVFANGRMSGTGNDELGAFKIEGTYSAESKEAQWVKSYPRKHSIDYRGFREGPKPGIWGEWHIWPLGNVPRDESKRLKQLLSKLPPGSFEKAVKELAHTKK